MVLNGYPVVTPLWSFYDSIALSGFDHARTRPNILLHDKQQAA